MKRSRDAQSINRCSTEHHRLVRAVLRANRTCSTADNPTPGASSNTTESPVCVPWRPWPSYVVRQSLLLQLSGFCIDKSNLLEARMIITPYNDHVGSFLRARWLA